MLESEYQGRLIKKIKIMFPGSVVLKNDTDYIQGMLDLTILFPYGFWATLEAKPHAGARRQPNQEYYVDMLNEMCFADFIYPENEEEVLRELQRSYEAFRASRVS